MERSILDEWSSLVKPNLKTIKYKRKTHRDVHGHQIPSGVQQMQTADLQTYTLASLKSHSC